MGHVGERLEDLLRPGNLGPLGAVHSQDKIRRLINPDFNFFLAFISSMSHYGKVSAYRKNVYEQYYELKNGLKKKKEKFKRKIVNRRDLRYRKTGGIERTFLLSLILINN